MVEVIKNPPRPRAAIIEKALLHVTSSLGSLLLCVDHLPRGYEVEQRKERHKIEESFGPLSPVPGTVPDNHTYVLEGQLRVRGYDDTY